MSDNLLIRAVFLETVRMSNEGENVSIKPSRVNSQSRGLKNVECENDDYLPQVLRTVAVYNEKREFLMHFSGVEMKERVASLIEKYVLGEPQDVEIQIIILMKDDEPVYLPARR